MIICQDPVHIFQHLKIVKNNQYIQVIKNNNQF